MTAQLCEYTKNHWTVHFKWVNGMVCKLYLNKVVIKQKRFHYVPLKYKISSQKQCRILFTHFKASELGQWKPREILLLNILGTRSYWNIHEYFHVLIKKRHLKFKKTYKCQKRVLTGIRWHWEVIKRKTNRICTLNLKVALKFIIVPPLKKEVKGKTTWLI